MSRPSTRYPDCWEEAEFEAESERLDKLAEAIAAEAAEAAEAEVTTGDEGGLA